MKKLLFLMAVVALVLTGSAKLPAQDEKGIEIRVLYDNYVCVNGDKGLKSDWGFACLVTGTEKTILFDTGRKGEVFLDNCENLHVNPKSVQLAVISHNHDDHTGGLLPFLEKNGKIAVYLPPSCEKTFIRQLEDRGAKVVVVAKLVEICKNVYVTTPTGDDVIEQALVLDTKKGLVVITGCSHPGVAKIARKAKEELKRDIYMICGGTHLSQRSEPDVQSAIAGLKELGVKRVGVTHCTGDKAIELFKQAFGDGYVPMGVGRLLKL